MISKYKIQDVRRSNLGTGYLADLLAGGLSELEDEFSDGKIQYAFARVTDPNTELPKFVLINWVSAASLKSLLLTLKCGAGVPEVKKGLFHSHSQDVANFLKGYHVSINAREESEVDPGQIMRKVRDSSGSKYSVHNESGNKYNPPSETVKSAYTPVKVPDIAALQRSAPQDKLTPVGTNYVPTKVDMAALKGAKETSAPITSFNKPASSIIPPPPKPAAPVDDWDADANDDAKPTSSIASRAAAFGGGDAERPVVSSLNSHRAELEALRSGKLGQSTQEPASGPVGTQWEPVSLPKPKPLANRFPVATTTSSTPVVPRSAASGPSLWEQKRAQAAAAVPVPVPDPTPNVQEPTIEDTPDQADADTEAAAEEERSRLEKLRIQEEEDQKAEQAEAEAREAAAAEQQRKKEEEAAVMTAAAASAGVAAGSEIAVAEPPTAPETNGATASAETTAVVLFEYEAGEPNEIDLVEGHIITDVDQVDEGWWEGTDPSGKRGLFPSNYVEIQAGGGASVAHNDDAANASAAAAAAEEARLREEEDARLAEEEAERQRQEEETAAAAAAAAAAASAPGVGGATATALYDYDAQEENEISFREGEVITEIEMVADDWWQGSVNGQNGLFPANYVEMQ